MSLDDHDKIRRNVGELRTLIGPTSMSFDVAAGVDKSLNGIDAIAKIAGEGKARYVDALIDVIEGLLASWPHTEAVRYYTPAAHPVLKRDIALQRASLIIRDRSIK